MVGCRTGRVPCLGKFVTSVTTCLLIVSTCCAVHQMLAMQATHAQQSWEGLDVESAPATACVLTTASVSSCLPFLQTPHALPSLHCVGISRIVQFQIGCHCGWEAPAAAGPLNGLPLQALRMDALGDESQVL